MTYSDLFNDYKCIIDFNKKQLITNVKTIPLLKVTDDIISINDSNMLINLITSEMLLKFKMQPRNTDAMLTSFEVEKLISRIN